MSITPIKKIKSTTKTLDKFILGAFLNNVDTRRYLYNNGTSYYTIPINGEYTIRAYQGANGAYGKVFGDFRKGERLTITIGNSNYISITSSYKATSEFNMYINKNAVVYANGANFNGAMVVGGAGNASDGGSATLYGDGIAYGGGGGAYIYSGTQYGYNGGDAYIYGNGYAYGGGGGAAITYPDSNRQGKGGSGYQNGVAVSSWRGNDGKQYQGGNSRGCGGAVSYHGQYTPTSSARGGSGAIGAGSEYREGGSARSGASWGSFGQAPGYFAGGSALQDYMNYTTAQYNGGDGGTGGFFGGNGGLAADSTNKRRGNGGTGTYGVGGYGYYGGDGQIRGGAGEYKGGNGFIAGYAANNRNGSSIRHKPIVHSRLENATYLGPYNSIVIVEYGHSPYNY